MWLLRGRTAESRLVPEAAGEIAFRTVDLLSRNTRNFPEITNTIGIWTLKRLTITICRFLEYKVLPNQ